MDSELSQIWEIFLQEVEKKSMSPVSFATWFSRMRPKTIDLENNKVVIAVPSTFIRDFLFNNKRHYNMIQNCLKDVLGRTVDVSIVLEGEEEQSPKIHVEVPDNSRLNPKYTFESFVVGKSNEFAHAASLAVAESYDNPHSAHSNPLFLYGGVGLGKTHLMHAIGHFTLNQDPSKKVLYVTSEQFTNEMINSIQRNKNEEFRNKYRKVDLLLVDDIQFIANKEGTQEEFFHTFNELHENNKQIVLTSDKPPQEIKTLEERLISRFAWGLVVDIQPPDLETRIAILRSKANAEGFNVPDDVINYIAEHVQSNIRELEGALSRVTAYSKLTIGEISVETAAIVLKDIYSAKKKKQIDTTLIKNMVCKVYDITMEEMNSKKRTKAIAYPRQIAMYISRELTDLSLPKIGEEFGGRDHSTVIHAYEKIQKDMEEDTALKIKITNLMKQIKE